MPQSTRARIAHGDRFADQSRGTFVVDLGFCCESETRLDDDVAVVGGLAGADSRVVGAEVVGVD